jgi:hypothetical protein
MIATRLVVTPFEVRLAICFRAGVARLVGFADLRGGIHAHAQLLNGLENLPEEAINLFYYSEEKGAGQSLP